MDNQGDRHRLDTNRRGIVLFKRPQLGSNAIINHSVRRFPGVVGPHPREFLCNGKEGVGKCFSPDGSTTRGNSTISVSCCRDLQVRDGIRDILEEGVNVVASAEITPERTMGSLSCGVGRSDCIAHCFFDNNKIRLEFISLRRWHICQGTGCGKSEVKYVTI